jgi:hypothetical protein
MTIYLSLFSKLSNYQNWCLIDITRSNTKMGEHHWCGQGWNPAVEPEEEEEDPTQT